MLRRILICVTIILCASIMFLVGGFFFTIHHLEVDRQIGGPMKITPEWVEITPTPPLVPSRNVQMIELKVDEPFASLAEPDFRRIVLAGSNTITSPQVQVVDDRGQTYNLETVSDYPHPSDYEGRMSFSSSRDLPQDRKYTKVRIRSDHAFKIGGVYWHCHTYK